VTGTRGGGATVERLLQDLGADGGRDAAINDELRRWLTGSRRFLEFVEAYRDKIRKKLRTAADADGLRDVRAELRFAHLLLTDRHIEVAFEAYGSTRGGPDFTVVHRGERPFNCEVTRLRRAPDEVTDGGPLLGKLRQLPPSAPNLLVIAVEGTSGAALEIEAAVRILRRRADAKEEDFFARRGFESARDFYARFLRLSAVIVWCEGAAGAAQATLWTNPSARIAVPARAIRACVASLPRPTLDGGGKVPE
jgi:hypothetical protein